MSAFTAALVLIGMTVLVGFAVWALLEGRRITHPIYKRGDYGLTDDDAPRDDNDWPPDDPESFEAWMRKKYGLNDPTP